MFNNRYFGEGYSLFNIAFCVFWIFIADLLWIKIVFGVLSVLWIYLLVLYRTNRIRTYAMILRPEKQRKGNQ